MDCNGFAGGAKYCNAEDEIALKLNKSFNGLLKNPKLARTSVSMNPDLLKTENRTVMVETPNCGAVVLETNTYEKPNSVQPALHKRRRWRTL